ncbi:proline dehydrogenase [Rhodococcus triatomae]|nr:proline dehydrogenase family protein [Rhodococcus triatomae]QNG21197.1 proline dehydrogenase [Rhodococcus triatomae]QNG25513.1 proline dehydrogenase [Rhodococcus triatomae]
MRPAILAAARSAWLEDAVTHTRATRALVDRFVAGETRADVLEVTRELLDSGRAVTVDFLGEDTTDLITARDVVQEYLELIADLTELVPDRGSAIRPVEVSVKLSALGLHLERDGTKVATENARTLCAAAEASGLWVTIDAEDHTTTDPSLGIVRELRRSYPWLGAVLQAYLHRTEQDCRALATPASRTRLCKGAYAEPASVAYTGRDQVTDSYLRCLRVLMSGAGYPMVASHDPAVVEAAAPYAAQAGRGVRDYEHQMLYGIRDIEQTRLVAAGRQVRVYVPYGRQWYGYFMRRLAERPSNLRFFLRSVLTRT